MGGLRSMLAGLALVTSGALVMVGCGTGTTMPDAAASPPECEAITSRCHPLDPGSGPIHECHEMAEATTATAASCMAQQAMCFAVCVAPADGGTEAGTDSGAGGDASVDGGGGG